VKTNALIRRFIAVQDAVSDGRNESPGYLRFQDELLHSQKYKRLEDTELKEETKTVQVNVSDVKQINMLKT
jgi:hypothetical protein